MSTISIQLNNRNDGGVVEFIINIQIQLLHFFSTATKKCKGALWGLGKYIVFILLCPFIIITTLILSLYCHRLYKKLVSSRREITKYIKELEYDQIKALEEEISKPMNQFRLISKDLRSLKHEFLFRGLYKSIWGIYTNFKKISIELHSTYTIPQNEYSLEEQEQILAYWNKVKTNKPQTFSAVLKDRSGEKTVFKINRKEYAEL